MYGAATRGSSSADIRSWVAERFAPKLTCANDFGVEGCMTLDVIGRHQLPKTGFDHRVSHFWPRSMSVAALGPDVRRSFLCEHLGDTHAQRFAHARIDPSHHGWE